MFMEEENQVNNPGKLVNCDMCGGHVSHEYVRRPVRLQWGWGMLGVEFVQERGNMQCVFAAILGFGQGHQGTGMDGEIS